MSGGPANPAHGRHYLPGRGGAPHNVRTADQRDEARTRTARAESARQRLTHRAEALARCIDELVAAEGEAVIAPPDVARAYRSWRQAAAEYAAATGAPGSSAARGGTGPARAECREWIRATNRAGRR